MLLGLIKSNSPELKESEVFPRGIKSPKKSSIVDLIVDVLSTLNVTNFPRIKAFSMPNKVGNSKHKNSHTFSSFSSHSNGNFYHSSMTLTTLLIDLLTLDHQPTSWLEIILTGLTVPLTIQIEGRMFIILIQNPSYLA